MEFFNQMRGYILIFIFLGLWTSFHHFKSKHLLRMYSICLLLSLFLLFAVSMYYTQFYSFTTIPNTVTNIFYVMIWVIHFVVIFESILKTNTQKQLIDKFNYVDEFLKIKLNTRIAYRTEKCDLFKRNLTLSSVVMPIYIAVTIFMILKSDSFNTMYLSTFSFFMIRLRVTQTFHFIFLLRNRLNLINDKLKHLSKVVQTPNDVTVQAQRLVRIFSCSSLNFPINETLMNLKHIYRELYEICELINSTFGISLLGVLTQNFFDLITNSYWAYLLRNDFGYFCTFIGLMIPNIFVLGVFCFYCTSLYREVSTKHHHFM